MSKKDLRDVNWQSQISEIEQQQQEQNGFDSMIPSIQKLLIWLIYITGLGMIVFPYFALTIDPKLQRLLLRITFNTLFYQFKQSGIHFWILTGIDFGLFIALLNFKRFVVSGNTLQQNDEISDNKQDVVQRERLLVFGFGAAVIYPQLDSKFELYYQDTKLNQFIKDKSNEIKKGYFLPTPYLGYGILQAVFGSKSQFRHEKINYEKKYIDFGDYGELRYDVAKLENDNIIPIEKREKNKNNCLVILLGITASTQEPYVENMTAEALKEGYTVVLYNDRLYNNYEDKGKIFPKSGYYSIVMDFEKALSQIQQDFSGYNFYAVGHSFGANTLVKYLGNHPNSNPFKGAVSVGNPFDIKQAFATLRPTFDKYLVESRQTVLKMRQSLLQNPPPHININLEKALKAVNTTEFDEHFSKHLYGHKTIFDYYEDLSCINQLKNVQIPLLCLNSKDDPCIHHSTIPFNIAQINKNVMLLVTKCGGHVGWFEGIFTPKRWYMKPTLEFLDALTEYPGSK